MSTKPKKEVEELEEPEEEERSPLFEAVRKVVLAGVGAVALAQDELEDFVNRLVERGEIAERDARKLMREVTTKRRKRVEKEMDKRLESILDSLNIPSKSDIDELGHKIATLSTKVEELKKA
jgi:polyhydroxyalkanoate synthesis regulator phasin